MELCTRSNAVKPIFHGGGTTQHMKCVHQQVPDSLPLILLLSPIPPIAFQSQRDVSPGEHTLVQFSLVCV